jgi:cob(I)alamin adenosyltransferase
VSETKGLVYVFTGEGKGKTSAAIGTAARACGVGMRVVWIGFYKQASWKLSEVEPLKKLGVEVFLMGKGFHLQDQKAKIKKQNDKVKTVKVKTGQVVVDSASQEEHGRAAEEALEKAKEFLIHSKSEIRNSKQIQNSKSETKRVDLLVLDEVNNALKDGLIEWGELARIITNRGKVHFILTGRDAHPELVKLADLVTEMKKVKHPYDEGRLAVRGLDF